MSKEGSFFVFIDKKTVGSYKLIPGARYKTTNLAMSKYQSDAREAGVTLEAGDRVIIMNVSRVLNLTPAPGFKEQTLDLDQLVPSGDAESEAAAVTALAHNPDGDLKEEPKKEDSSEVVLPDDVGDGEGLPEPAEAAPAEKPEEPVVAAPAPAGGSDDVADDDLFGDKNDII
jgi:hypothetical protein